VSNPSVKRMIFAFAVSATVAVIGISCSEYGGEAGGAGGAGTSLINEIPSVAAFDAVVDTTKGSLVGFDLMAPWCGACRMLKPVLEQVAKTNQGKVIMYRVDVQKLPEIAQRLGVRGIPYVLFVKDRLPITALTGAQGADAYQAIIDRATPSTVTSDTLRQQSL
jgi:thioredoxin-like negative regulator of GroEL